MTKQEERTLRKLIEETQHPSAPGHIWDLLGGKMTAEAPLVSDVPNHKLLDSELYKAGYRRAHKEIAERIQWLFLNGTPETRKADQRKYAGRAK